MRLFLIPSILTTIITLVATSSGSAQLLLQDDFTSPGIDPGKWIVHGDGVVNPGGFLVVSCSYGGTTA